MNRKFHSLTWIDLHFSSTDFGTRRIESQ